MISNAFQSRHMLGAALVAGFAHAGQARAEAAEPAHAEAGEPEEAHEHHHDHLAIFLGATTALADGHATKFTVGADYEHRLPFAGGKLGAGLLVDSTVGDDVETLVAPFVAYHPVGGLLVLGAVGVEVTGAGHDGHLGLRGAAAYFVHAGTLSVGPVVSIDHVNHETAIVYGASVGGGF